MDVFETDGISGLPVGLPTRLTFVYDADGTLRGEVTYIVGHLLGRLSCSMCDISHGPLGRRKAWIAWANALAGHGIEVVTLHRDELNASLSTVIAGHFPVAVATYSDGTERVVLNKMQLEACEGKVALLNTALASVGLIPEGLPVS